MASPSDFVLKRLLGDPQYKFDTCFVLQFSTDELVEEVENSIAEFKKHNQEYDEERIKEQVCSISLVAWEYPNNAVRKV